MKKYRAIPQRDTKISQRSAEDLHRIHRGTQGINGEIQRKHKISVSL